MRHVTHTLVLMVLYQVHNVFASLMLVKAVADKHYEETGKHYCQNQPNYVFVRLLVIVGFLGIYFEFYVELDILVINTIVSQQLLLQFDSIIVHIMVSYIFSFFIPKPIQILSLECQRLMFIDVHFLTAHSIDDYQELFILLLL